MVKTLSAETGSPSVVRQHDYVSGGADTSTKSSGRAEGPGYAVGERRREKSTWGGDGGEAG